MTPEELDSATAAYHQHSFEDMVLWALCQAAAKNPVAIREAFGTAFGASGVVGEAQRALNLAFEAQRVMQETRAEFVALQQQIEKQLSELDRRMDGLLHKQQQLERRTA